MLRIGLSLRYRRIGTVDQKATLLTRLAPAGSARRDQVVGYIEDALRASIGNRPVEKPKLIAFPREPARPKIAALSVIIARCGVPRGRLRRQAIDDIHHPNQGAG